MAGKIILENGHLTVSNSPIILFIEGDGIGRDIWKDARAVFDAAIDKAYQGWEKVEWLELLASEKTYEATEEWLPETALETIKENLVVIRGPLEAPVGGRIRSLSIALRQELDSYACVHPIRHFKGIENPLKEPGKTSIIIFRENTKDIYAGIEWNVDTEEVKKVIDFLQNEMSISKIRLPETDSIGIKPTSREGSERLIRSAIEYALANNLTKITLVYKGNIQKFTEGGFHGWGYDLAEREYADELASGKLVIDDIIADDFLQQILLNLEKSDVVALTNLDNDYANDALATQVGGVEVSPGANINCSTGRVISEATHGTAPNIAGKDIANSCSVLLSGCMLFDHTGWTEVASLITTAIKRTFAQGRSTTDLAQGKVICSASEFAAKLIENL